MIHAYTRFAIQLGTPTARSRNGCVHPEGVMVSSTLFPDEDVTPDTSMGFVRYFRAGGVLVGSVVGSARSGFEYAAEDLPRSSMPLHGWVDDRKSAVDPIAAHLEDRQRTWGNDSLLISFHGLHMPEVMDYLKSLRQADADLAQPGSATALTRCLEATFMTHMIRTELGEPSASVPVSATQPSPVAIAA